MLSPRNQYLKLRRQAMRLMMIGDLQRYMRTLRELHDLRSRFGMAA
jgi:hypothetical protein